MTSPSDSRIPGSDDAGRCPDGGTPPVHAIVFAGGTGERMNSLSTPKQFLRIHGQTILQHTLAHFLNNPDVDGVVVVCLREWLPDVERELGPLLSGGHGSQAGLVVPGGATSQDSIYNGLTALREARVPNDAIVLVHDAVRPLIDGDLIRRNIDSVHQHGSAVTVAPEWETVVTLGPDGLIDSVLDRGHTRVAKAPQAFRLGSLLAAHDTARAEGRHDYIDSASLMKGAGHPLHPVAGPVANIKVTTPTDYYILRAVLDAQEAQQVFGLHVAGLGAHPSGVAVPPRP